MKVGINGAQRDITDVPSGINGAVRTASELWQGKNGATQKVWPLIPIGYQVILDTVGSGTWVCPASGQWEVEGHGGGYGGQCGSRSAGGAGGGGSGDVFTITLTAGQEVNYRVASGGRGAPASGHGRPSSGGDTTFGELTFYGASSRSGKGSLASAGNPGTPSAAGSGGKGNKNKPEQIYGNGGSGGRRIYSGTGSYSAGSDGKDGAIILTYLG